MTDRAQPLRVLFFAALRDQVGVAQIDLPIDQICSLDVVLGQLRERIPAAAFAQLCAENVRIALNQELITVPVACGPGDELAFLPPVTGG